MKLEEYKKDAYYFSGKLSEINRYLAFAGIAVIWIFKQEINDKLTIPSELILPLIMFIISLFLDFIQYVYSTTIWTIFFRYHENQKKKNPDLPKYKDDDIKSPKILPNISYFVFFYPKVVVNLIGYVFLIIYIWTLI